MEEQEAMRKAVLSKILERAAIERLGRVRLANPVLAAQLEAYLIQLYQAGQISGSIDDGKLKDILDALTTKKKTTITRK